VPLCPNALESIANSKSCLPSAKGLLDQRQTRYAVRAQRGRRPPDTSAANLRSGEFYGNEGATSQPSRIDWTRPEKTHRLFGRRLAQQLVRHVDYDTEYASVSTRVNTRRTLSNTFSDTLSNTFSEATLVHSGVYDLLMKIFFHRVQKSIPFRLHTKDYSKYSNCQWLRFMF
jgi:hypothetical protein